MVNPLVWRYKTGNWWPCSGVWWLCRTIVLAERIELIAKKTIHFSCHLMNGLSFSMKLTQQQIEYQESYTATGVDIEARLQIHQIEPLALKLRM